MTLEQKRNKLRELGAEIQAHNKKAAAEAAKAAEAKKAAIAEKKRQMIEKMKQKQTKFIDKKIE